MAKIDNNLDLYISGKGISYRKPRNTEVYKFNFDISKLFLSFSLNLNSPVDPFLYIEAIYYNHNYRNNMLI